MTKVEKPSTRARILQTALDLFNEAGVQSVATYKIAAKMKISPGNLTYHFATKNEIVRELVDQLESRIFNLLPDFRDPRQSSNVATHLTSIFRLMWRYRFFFEALNLFVQTDEELAARYRRLEADIRGVNTRLLHEVIDGGLMRPVRAPNSVELIADNLWSVWLFNIRSNRVGEGLPKRTESEAVHSCAIHHFSVLEPYFSKEFAQRLYSELDTVPDVPSVNDRGNRKAVRSG